MSLRNAFLTFMCVLLFSAKANVADAVILAEEPNYLNNYADERVSLELQLHDFFEANGALRLPELPANPEAHMDAIEVLQYYGYPAERHEVTTRDGYIFEMHRIPHGIGGTNDSITKRPAILMLHCLMGSSDSWLANPPKQSLGFLLADQGYDVWMGNVRGNTYGRKHVSYPVDSVQFWQFSWDHHALDDLPTMIDRVLEVTGQEQILIVAHSQGALSGLAGLSANATLRSKVKVFAGLGPVAYLGHTKSPLFAWLKHHASILTWMTRIFGMQQFLPNTWYTRDFANKVCRRYHMWEEVCENGLFLVVGFDKDQTNITRLDVYMNHMPAGTSMQNVVHFVQMAKSGAFQRFDYGTPIQNLVHYKQSTPPFYYLSNVTLPVGLFHATNDWFATPADVQLLKKDLPNCVVDYTVPLKTFSHVDFIWAMDANRLIYDELISFLNKYR